MRRVDSLDGEDTGHVPNRLETVTTGKYGDESKKVYEAAAVNDRWCVGVLVRSSRAAPGRLVKYFWSLRYYEGNLAE